MILLLFKSLVECVHHCVADWKVNDVFCLNGGVLLTVSLKELIMQLMRVVFRLIEGKTDMANHTILSMSVAQFMHTKKQEADPNLATGMQHFVQ